MALKSMTGFARSEGAHDGTRWHWEGRSVNGRGLELRFRLPTGFDALEAAARMLCQKRLARGNCAITLGLQRETHLTEIRLNETVLKQALDIAGAAAAMARMPPPSLDTLLSMRGVVETAESEGDEAAQQALTEALLDGLSAMLDDLVVARVKEGERLGTVIADQLSQIETLAGRARMAPGRQPEAVSVRLRAQVQALLSAGSELDPERLHQEAVLLFAKADIQEELDRLEAHVAAARELLREHEPVGRKLEFLAQELNREANTMCSKAGDIEISRIGLELKAVVDQFREQVANIE
jgi:uncharacterized protein (TIGR00255 family)